MINISNHFILLDLIQWCVKDLVGVLSIQIFYYHVDKKEWFVYGYMSSSSFIIGSSWWKTIRNLGISKWCIWFFICQIWSISWEFICLYSWSYYNSSILRIKYSFIAFWYINTTTSLQLYFWNKYFIQYNSL